MKIQIKIFKSEKAYKILKLYLLENKINRYDFNILFYTKELEQEHVSNGNKSGKKSFDTLMKRENLLIF